MAELLPGDSSDQLSDNRNVYEPRSEDIADLRQWGIRKYGRAGGYAEVSESEGVRPRRSDRDPCDAALNAATDLTGAPADT